MGAVATVDGARLDPTDKGDEPDEPTGASAPATRWPPTLAAVVGLGFGLWGLRIGSGSLHDNSFFTHFATGKLILDTHAVPSTDPYSFTAHGQPWVVQSWLASVIYALANKIGGLGLLRAVLGITTAVMAMLAWRLSRPAKGLLVRVVVTGLVVTAGVGYWVERPLTFGLVGLAILLLCARGEVNPKWMIPVMWLWTNAHGSFVLGLGLLVLFVAGCWLDGERGRTVELRTLGWATLGTALAAINPVGPKLLVFPLSVFQHSQAFSHIVEWQPPKWDEPGQWLFLVELAATVAVVLLRRRKWRSILPIVVFAAMAFTSARNIAPAMVVFLPILADGLQGIGTLDGERRSRATGYAAIGLVVLALVLGVAGIRSEPDLQLGAYPVSSITWMKAHGLLGGKDDRVVSPEIVGNLLEAMDGPDARVFMDDRVDMYPSSVVEGFIDLRELRPGWQKTLDGFRPTAVLWQRDKPLAGALAKSDDWKIVHRDKKWIVAVPT